MCLSAIGYNSFVMEDDNEQWYEAWFDVAMEHKMIDAIPERPSESISRLEASKIIWNMMNLPICAVIGWDVSEGISLHRLMDGTKDEEGTLYPLKTLYLDYFKDR